MRLSHRIWLGCCALAAVGSADVRASIEWTMYSGTFPGMVGSLCPSPYPPATYLAVRSQAEWVAFWEPRKPRVPLVPTMAALPIVPQPEVDFSKNIVVVVSSGCKPTGGYRVQIESIQDQDSSLTVNVIETEPGKGCATTQTVTEPSIFALIPQTQKEIKFRIRKAIHDCGD